MKQKELAVKAFMFFAFNYPSAEGFIRYICEKTGKTDLQNYLLEKFRQMQRDYGNHAVFEFYVCIDLDLRNALVDYACKVYYPKGFSSDKEGIALLAE